MRKLSLLSFAVFMLASSGALAQGSVTPPFVLNNILGVSDAMFLGMWDTGYNFSGTGHNLCPLDQSSCTWQGSQILPNGTSTSPALRFSGSSTSGFYYDTASSSVKSSGFTLAWTSVTGKPTIPNAPLTGTVTVTGGTSLLSACYSGTGTVTGAATGKVVSASWPTDPGGLISVAGQWVSATNTVSVKICNPSTGTTPNVTLNVQVAQ